jgi:sucrose phosphorylase
VAQTGRNRTINRQKFERATLEKALADPTSLRHQVFAAYTGLLRARAGEPAFHPHSTHQVLSLNQGVFALLRSSLDGSSRVLCLHNVSDKAQKVQICPSDLGLPPGNWRDVITGQGYTVDADRTAIPLSPYAVRWLKP